MCVCVYVHIHTHTHTHTHTQYVRLSSIYICPTVLQSHLRYSELHIALSTTDPHITKEDITDFDAAMFLRSGSDCVGFLYTAWCWW